MRHEEVHFRLTEAQQEAIQRIAREDRYLTVAEQRIMHSALRRSFMSIGELADDVMDKLGRRRDPDWVTEYLAHHDSVNHREEN